MLFRSMDNLYLYYQNSDSMFNFNELMMTGNNKTILENLTSILLRWKTDSSTIEKGFVLLSISNYFFDNSKYASFTKKYNFSYEGIFSNDNIIYYEPIIVSIFSKLYYYLLILGIIFILIGFLLFYKLFCKKSPYREYKFENKKSYDTTLI